MEYNAGVPINLPDTPSGGEGYFLSGRATMDALIEREARKVVYMSPEKAAKRYRPKREEMAELRERIRRCSKTFNWVGDQLGTGAQRLRDRLNAKTAFTDEAQWRRLLEIVEQAER